MTPLRSILALSALAVVGGWLVVTGWMPHRPSLVRVMEQLRRTERAGIGGESSGSSAPVQRLGRTLVAVFPVGDSEGSRRLMPDPADLRVISRSIEMHAVLLAMSMMAGFAGPIVLSMVFRATDLFAVNLQLALVVALALGALAPLAVHARAVERITLERTDLRHQFSAYLDVVTMLLAGNTGHEGALQQAAQAGDGRLFRELRRRMREIAPTGRSLVLAIDIVGRDYGIVELQQVAATASLSAAEGAPVARTLAAKCATLRSTLATEQEAEARLRTSRLTAPLVGLALIFMALVIYPALSS